MSERAPSSTPHNPSEAFAGDSRAYDDSQEKSSDDQRREEREGHVLDSEAAAYAAKPWMDVAVELYASKNAAAGVEGDETVYDSDSQGSLDYLTSYAERRAHQAAEGTRDDLMTEGETAMLDAFKAEAEMNAAQAAFDLDGLTNEQMSKAYVVASERARATKGVESAKWHELATRASEYEDMITGDVDEEDSVKLNRKLQPNAENAGFLLSMSKDGTIRENPPVKRSTVTTDIANMRRNTQLYELFAEIQASEQEVHDAEPATIPEQTNERQYNASNAAERRASLLQETARFESMIDPIEKDVGIFGEAGREIARQKRLSKGDEAAHQQWQELSAAYREYSAAFEEDREDRFPDDPAEAQRRRNLMQFLASVYPMQEKPNAKTPTAEQEKTAESANEYNPDDTMLPTSEKGRTLMRRNFANEYFSDQSHQQLTPENVKVLKDYMVHELRGEMDYARRQGTRVPGGQEALFSPIFTLDQLEDKGRASNKFAYDLVAHNTNNPDLMYAQFEQMSIKDVAQAIGFDITQHVEDYDKNVGAHVSRAVYEEKPYKIAPLR
jgi:hypothetical protein